MHMRRDLMDLAARELAAMEVLQMGHLERRAEQLVEEQSASVRRELSFLRAIIHRPRLLLLDDPFNGMESAQKLAMEELFAILAEDEVTVLMASQSLPDAAHLCGEIGIIEKGRIISEGNLSDIFVRQEARHFYIFVSVKRLRQLLPFCERKRLCARFQEMVILSLCILLEASKMKLHF